MSDPSAAPVSVSYDADAARAALRLSHAKGNSLTLQMIGELRHAIAGLPSRPRLKLVTIEGAGADFSFGAYVPEHTQERIGQVLAEMHRLIQDLLELRIPTAAVVRGRCLGGGFELALACDFVFAAESATFGLPEIALGLFPPFAAALLPWRIGGARATRLIMTGANASARECEGYGLVTLLAPDDQLDAAVSAWFEKNVSRRSAAALGHAAAAARNGLLMQVRTELPQLVRSYLHDLMRSADAAEGLAAFLDKRSPRWQDR